jgi:hypothetical protein
MQLPQFLAPQCNRLQTSIAQLYAARNIKGVGTAERQSISRFGNSNIRDTWETHEPAQTVILNRLFDKIAGDSHQKLVHQNKDPQSPMATITFQDSKLVILATIKKIGTSHNHGWELDVSGDHNLGNYYYLHIE